MKISIVIPCYNEERTIEPLVSALLQVPMADREVIIVDDASTDGTRGILREIIEKQVDRVIYQPENRGKGAALRAGFAAATGDVVVIQDADLEYDCHDILVLVGPILEGRADVVYGSRFLDARNVAWNNWSHRYANRVLTAASNLFTGLAITDMETCYKAFKKDALAALTVRENGFGCEPEITAKIARLGCRICEVPVSYRPRTYKDGKKIRPIDALRALWCIAKYSR